MFAYKFIQNFKNFPLINCIAVVVCIVAVAVEAAASGQFEQSNIVFPKTLLKRQRSFDILKSNAVNTNSVIELSRAAEAFSLEFFQVKKIYVAQKCFKL